MALLPPRQELKVFERLENMTKNESFDSAATFVRKFVNGNLDLNNTYQSVLEGDESDGSAKVGGGQEPLFQDKSCTDSDSESEVEVGAGGGEDLNVNVPMAHSPLSLPEESCSECDSNIEDNDGENSYTKTVALDSEIGGATGFVLGDNEISSSEGEEEEDYSDSEDNDPEGAKPYQSTAYLLLSEMKRALELQETQLERERKAFTDQKASEEKKLAQEKQKAETQRKSLERLVADYHKMKTAKSEQEGTVKDLTDKLRETRLEMNKRINRWGDQQRKLEERVKVLEKENSELKKQKSLQYRPSTLKRPPMLNSTLQNSQKGNSSARVNAPSTSKQPQPKRIHFADEDSTVGTKSKPPLSKPTGGVLKNQGNVEEEGDSKNKTEIESNVELPETQTNNRFHNSNLEKDEISPTGQNSNHGEISKEISLNEEGADKTMPGNYLEVRHACGTITRITKDNMFTRHIMPNKDVMEEFEDCSVRYYYAEQRFSQITYPNGDEIIEYDSGVIETHRADGTQIFTYSNGLVKIVDPLNREEIYFPDGSVMKKDGVESTVIWPSGQKEVRTPSFVKRIYTNGTVKIRYSDGSEETQYWNGRIRRKDKNGKLVDDIKKRKNRPQKANQTV